jgi:hypothetical protein
LAAKPKITALVSNQTSPVLQAADLVSALIKHTKMKSLAELFEHGDAKDEAVLAKLSTIQLSEDQISLIEENGHHVQYIRSQPTVNITECPVCLSVGVVGPAVSKACTLKLGCPGNPVKSSFAKKVLVAE